MTWVPKAQQVHMPGLQDQAQQQTFIPGNAGAHMCDSPTWDTTPSIWGQAFGTRQTVLTSRGQICSTSSWNTVYTEVCKTLVPS